MEVPDNQHRAVLDHVLRRTRRHHAQGVDADGYERDQKSSGPEKLARLGDAPERVEVVLVACVCTARVLEAHAIEGCDDLIEFLRGLLVHPPQLALGDHLVVVVVVVIGCRHRAAGTL